MARIVGVEIPDKRKIWYSLTKIYGIGKNNVRDILEKAGVDGDKRVIDLDDKQISRLQKVIDESLQVEGDLRRDIQENIKRLKAIGTYRGVRHIRNLPVRGQRTRSNARTKRGKRKTVGAIRKDMAAKMEKKDNG